MNSVLALLSHRLKRPGGLVHASSTLRALKERPASPFAPIERIASLSKHFSSSASSWKGKDHHHSEHGHAPAATEAAAAASSTSSVPVLPYQPGYPAHVSSALPEIFLETKGSLRVINLNRPKALHALTLDMVRKLTPLFQAFDRPENNIVRTIVLRSTTAKAFCAGGDVRKIVEAAKQGDLEAGKKFFREEYQLNHLIATHKLPVVSILHGITMGGGVGLSVHGVFRIATESSVFAMPETAIGFIPDVGGTYFLSRMGAFGKYLGLTGHRLKGADLVYAGIATHYVPEARLESLIQRLAEIDSSDSNVINGALNEFVEKLPPTHLFANMYNIDRTFSAPLYQDIEENLLKIKDESAWAASTLETLKKMSRTSLDVTTSAIHIGDFLSLKQCLKLEYGLAQKFLSPDSDFVEGVRGVLIDKSKPPVFAPKKSTAEIDAFFDFVKFPEDDSSEELPALFDVENDDMYAASKVEQLEFSIQGGQSDVSSHEFVVLSAFELIYMLARFGTMSRAAIFNVLAPLLSQPGNTEMLTYMLDYLCESSKDDESGETLYTLRPFYLQMYLDAGVVEESN